MRTAIALLLAAIPTTAAQSAQPTEEWVDMSAAGNGSVLVGTKSVKGSGNRRVVSALFSSDSGVRDGRLEMDCPGLKYRIVGQDKWSSNDPTNVRRVCRGDFAGLRRYTEADVKRMRKDAPLSAQQRQQQQQQQMIDALGGLLNRLVSGPANGVGLLQICGSESRTNQATCSWYIAGLRDAARYYGPICDGNATGQQVQDGIVATLRKLSQAELRKSSAELVLPYLKTTYPCRKEPKV